MTWHDTLEIFYENDPSILADWSSACGVECDLTPGFYYWFCFPGCLPEGDGMPIGPFASEKEAFEDAELYNGDES